MMLTKPTTKIAHKISASYDESNMTNSSNIIRMARKMEKIREMSYNAKRSLEIASDKIAPTSQEYSQIKLRKALELSKSHR